MRLSYFGIMLGIFLMISSLGYGQTEPDINLSSIYIPRSDWFWRFGDSPLDSQGVPVWTYEDIGSDEWQSVTEQPDILSNRSGNYMWIKIDLPIGHWVQPMLYIPPVSRNLEVYHNRHRIYRFGEFRPTNRGKYWILRSHLVPLAASEINDTVKTVFLRIYSDSKYIDIQGNEMWLCSSKRLIWTYFIYRLDGFVVGPLLLLAGLLSLFVYFRRRKQGHYILLSFSGFVICTGMGQINTLTQLSDVAAGLRYLITSAAVLMWPIALYIFIEQIIGRGYKSLIRRIWQFHIALAVFTLLLDNANVISMDVLTPVFLIVLGTGIIIAAPIIIIASIGGNYEARIFCAGMGIIMLAGAYDISSEFGIISKQLYLFSWSIFIFVLFMAYILEYRFARMNRQLEEYSLTLEQKVADRTQKLSEKNSELALTLEQLRETQNHLIMQEKMASLGVLVAGVAHEMNNPTGVVRSAADTAKRGLAKIKTSLQDSSIIEKLRNPFSLIEKNHEIITTASERIAETVQNLKAFATLDEALFQQVDIHDNIDTTISLLYHELKDRVTIIKEYGEIPGIQCYPNELNQAFMNLFMNSIYAIDDKGTITITTNADAEKIYIRISDTGSGIPEEDLPKVYDPGFTTKDAGVGKGLGLSIVYNIVQKHNGNLKINSEAGKGTDVTIALPVKQKLG